MAEEIKATGNEVPFGSFIPASTIKQIKVRGKLARHEPKSLEEIKCLNNNSWVVLRSGVNTENSAEIAKKYTLVGGIQTGLSGNKRGGIGSDGAYYEGTFGTRPMPGITNVAVKNLDTWGCVREAEVSLSVWSMEDLANVSKVFFRPGFSALLEWGHSVYVDNTYGSKTGGSIQTMNSRTACISDDEWFDTSKSLLDFDKELKERAKKYDGNYDGLCGLITNFSYDFQKNGSFNCTVKILSRGSVIFCVKESDKHIQVSDIRRFLAFTMTKDAETGPGSGQTKININDSSFLPVIQQRPTESTYGFNALYMLENMEKYSDSTVNGTAKKNGDKNSTSHDFFAPARKLLPLFCGGTFPIYKQKKVEDVDDAGTTPTTEQGNTITSTSDLLSKGKAFNSLSYIRLRDFLWLLNRTMATSENLLFDLSTPYKFAVVPGMISLNPLIAALSQDFKASGQQNSSGYVPDTTTTSLAQEPTDIDHACFPIMDITFCVSQGGAFGVAADGIRNHVHQGVDLSGIPVGTPVHAIAIGRVIRADIVGKGAAGKYVTLSVGHYNVSYMHLSEVKVKQGQTITRGQIIGAVGSTGHSTGPHLHLQLKDTNTGAAYNPQAIPWYSENYKPTVLGFYIQTKANQKMSSNGGYSLTQLNPVYNASRSNVVGNVSSTGKNNFVCNIAKFYQDTQASVDPALKGLEIFNKNVIHPAIASNCIGDISLNLTYVLNCIQNLEDNSEGGIGGLIQDIMTGVQKAFGGINDFGLHITEDNTIAVVDRNFIDPYEGSSTNIEDVTIPVTGTESTMVQVSLKSAITSTIANQMSIAATSPRKEGSVGLSPVSLLYLNGDYVDRHRIPGSQAIDASGNTVDTSADGGNAKAPDFIAQTIVSYNSMLAHDRSYDYEDVFQEFENASLEWQALINKCWCSEVLEGSAFQTGVVPVELGLETKGISGFLIGSCFKIHSGITLPEYNNWGYIVTGVDHIIGTGGWTTKVKTQYFPLVKEYKKS